MVMIAWRDWLATSSPRSHSRSQHLEHVNRKRLEHTGASFSLTKRVTLKQIGPRLAEWFLMTESPTDHQSVRSGPKHTHPCSEQDMARRQAWASLKFGPFSVANQIFHVSQSQLSYALVNLKPLLPGHVLVCPTRCVPRLSQLTTEETTDLFLSVKRVSRTMERLFNASSLNVAVQDGVDAGQSVPHVQVS
jgi:hypothetical protein